MRRRTPILLSALMGGALVVSSTADATPPSNISFPRFVAGGALPDAINISDHLPDGTQLRLRTSGPLSIYHFEVTIGPGGSTGWHSHDGVVFTTVKSGTITAYEADRRECVATTLETDDAYVERSDPIVLRNETQADATIITTGLLA